MEDYFNPGVGDQSGDTAHNASREQGAESLQAPVLGVGIDQIFASASLGGEGSIPQPHSIPLFSHAAEELPIGTAWGYGEVDHLSQWMDYTVAPTGPCIACHLQNAVCQIINGNVSQETLTCILCMSQSLLCSLSTGNGPSNIHIPDRLPHNQTLQSQSNCEEMLNLQGSYDIFGLPSPGWPSVAPVLRSQDERPSRSRTRYSPGADILGNGLPTHQGHHYPTETEEGNWQSRSDLNQQQLRDWLGNAQQDQLTGITEPIPSYDGLLQSMEIPMRDEQQEINRMGPMERWQHSHPESDLTATNDDVSTDFNFPTSRRCSQIPNAYPTMHGGTSRSQAEDSSPNSTDTEVSSESQQSAYSQRSRASIGMPTKRGRRRRRQIPNTPGNTMSDNTRQYQCTFCVESFKTKHDWQRHEKSLHLSLERWICAPNGGTIIKEPLMAPTCVFCDTLNPSNSHMESHNYTTCLERTQEERTFYRKDHLRQHLRLVHNCKLSEPETDKWKVVIANVRSRCGFCDMEMESWPQRIDHIAEHFRSGTTMDDWKGDWGFEPHIQKLLENEIPPGGACLEHHLDFSRSQKCLLVALEWSVEDHSWAMTKQSQIGIRDNFTMSPSVGYHR